MAQLRPCIEKIELPQKLKDYIISQREIHAKKGLSESAADLLTAKELQEKILDEVHNVYNRLGVKGYENLIESKGELAAVKTEVLDKRSNEDIEKRMIEIEGDKKYSAEFNLLEKEMNKRERSSVFDVPLSKVNDAIDVLIKKEKEKPNGYGSFIESRDARETKEVANRYLNAKKLTDAELKKDFSDAVRGNPATWYADGLKMREALKEATSRGIDTNEMLAEVTKAYTDAGYDIETAKSVVANMLKPIFEGSKKVNEKQISELPETEIPITSKEASPPNEPPIEAGEGTKPFEEEKRTVLSHRGLQEVATEFGLDDITSRERKTDLELFKDADNTITGWVKEGTYPQKVEKLITTAENKGSLSDEQNVILAQHIANMRKELSDMDINSPDYNAKLKELQRVVKAGEIARSTQGAALRVPILGSKPRYDLPDMMVQKMNANEVTELTEQQKEQVKKDYEEISKRAAIAEEKNAMLEAKVAEYKAKLEVNRESKVPKPKEKRYYKAERQSLREQLKQQVAEYKAASQKMGIASDGGGEAFIISTKMAKTIGEIAKSHIAEVGDNIKEVVKRTMDEVKDLVTGISEKDIHDIIAGKYLSDEQKIAKLKAIKQGNESKAQEIQEKIDKGDFSEETKLAFLDDMEIRRKFPKEYKEAMDSKVELTKKQHDYEIALAKDEMKRQTPVKKYVFRPVKMTLNTYKAIKAGFDDSFVMIQGGLAMMANPAAGVDALKKQTLDFFSEKRFNREIAAIHNNKELMRIIDFTGVKILDPKSLLEANRDETIGGNNWLNQQFKVRDKKYSLGRYTTAPFERLYTSMGNNLRLNLLLQKVQDMYADGKTLETHPQDFKDLGTVINTMTGIGKVHKKLEASTDAISTVIWSPKLLASGFNILGVGDVGNFVMGGNKGYYSALTPEMRRYAISQTVKGILMGSAIMFAWSRNPDKEVDLDPTSVTFGSVKDKKSGNSYNIFGRFTPIVRLIAVQMMGYKTVNGKRIELNKGMGPSRGGEIAQFVRGKFTPAAGLATDVATQKDYSGQKFDIANVPKDLLPMSVSEIKKGIEQNGASGLFTRGLASFYGVKVSNEQDFNKRSLKVPEWRFLADKGLKVTDLHKEGLSPVDEKGSPVEITDDKFKEVVDKRDEIIKKEVADLMDKGGIDWEEGKRIKTADITPDQLKSWLMKISKRATKEATEKVFGEQPAKESEVSIETYK
jgi:hypothetical protein